MEMLLYQSTQFRDVKKILDRAHGFAGLLTAGGIEASRLDVPFVCDQKVLSRYDDACSDVRRILTMQLGLTLPKGFSIPLEAEDLAVFFSQQCGLQQMQDYLTQKRARTQADIQTWLRDRPWDTHPVTAAQAAAQNLVFDAQTGRIGTDGCFNGGTVLELPSSVDGVRVRALGAAAYRPAWAQTSQGQARRVDEAVHGGRARGLSAAAEGGAVAHEGLRLVHRGERADVAGNA